MATYQITDNNITEENSIFQTHAPSEDTYSQLESMASQQTTSEVQLRAAPPGGNPIGGVPLDSPSLFSLIIPITIYIIINRFRKKRCQL